MSVTGTRLRAPTPLPSQVLAFVATWAGRTGIVGGQPSLALPGPTATDVGRGLGTLPEKARAVLADLVAAGVLRMQRVGTYSCYLIRGPDHAK